MPSTCGYIVNNLWAERRTICVGLSTDRRLQASASITAAHNPPLIHSSSTTQATRSSTGSDRTSASVGGRVIPTFHSTYNHHHIL